MIPLHSDWDEEEKKALERLRAELEELHDLHKNDPPLELFQAARAGILPDELQEATEAHLEHSAWSRALAEGAESIQAELASDEQERLLTRIQSEAQKGRRARGVFSFFRRPAFALAAILLAASAVVLWRYNAVSSRLPAPPRAQTPPAAPAQPITAPAPPAFVLALEKPPVKLTADALLSRGSFNGSRFLDDLAPAMEAYRDGRYADAVRQFTALIPRYPRSTEVFFYMGASRLLLDDFSGAIPALQSAREIGDASFAPDISWCLALSYERVGRPAEARAEVEPLCGGKSMYAARACKALEQFRVNAGR